MREDLANTAEEIEHDGFRAVGLHQLSQHDASLGWYRWYPASRTGVFQAKPTDVSDEEDSPKRASQRKRFSWIYHAQNRRDGEEIAERDTTIERERGTRCEAIRDDTPEREKRKSREWQYLRTQQDEEPIWVNHVYVPESPRMSEPEIRRSDHGVVERAKENGAKVLQAVGQNVYEVDCSFSKRSPSVSDQVEGIEVFLTPDERERSPGTKPEPPQVRSNDLHGERIFPSDVADSTEETRSPPGYSTPPPPGVGETPTLPGDERPKSCNERRCEGLEGHVMMRPGSSDVATLSPESDGDMELEERQGLSPFLGPIQKADEKPDSDMDHGNPKQRSNPEEVTSATGTVMCPHGDEQSKDVGAREETCAPSKPISSMESLELNQDSKLQCREDSTTEGGRCTSENRGALTGDACECCRGGDELHEDVSGRDEILVPSKPISSTESPELNQDLKLHCRESRRCTDEHRGAQTGDAHELVDLCEEPKESQNLLTIRTQGVHCRRTFMRYDLATQYVGDRSAFGRLARQPVEMQRRDVLAHGGQRTVTNSKPAKRSRSPGEPVMTRPQICAKDGVASLFETGSGKKVHFQSNELNRVTAWLECGEMRETEQARGDGREANCQIPGTCMMTSGDLDPSKASGDGQVQKGCLRSIPPCRSGSFAALMSNESCLDSFQTRIGRQAGRQTSGKDTSSFFKTGSGKSITIRPECVTRASNWLEEVDYGDKPRDVLGLTCWPNSTSDGHNKIDIRSRCGVDHHGEATQEFVTEFGGERHGCGLARFDSMDTSKTLKIARSGADLKSVSMFKTGSGMPLVIEPDCVKRATDWLEIDDTGQDGMQFKKFNVAEAHVVKSLVVTEKEGECGGTHLVKETSGVPATVANNSMYCFSKTMQRKGIGEADPTTREQVGDSIGNDRDHVRLFNVSSTEAATSKKDSNAVSTFLEHEKTAPTAKKDSIGEMTSVNLRPTRKPASTVPALPDGTSLFSTGRGNQVRIGKEAFRKAQNLLSSSRGGETKDGEETSREGEDMVLQDSLIDLDLTTSTVRPGSKRAVLASGVPDGTSLFSTGRGNKVNIREEDINKAQNLLSPSRENFMEGDESLIRNPEHCRLREKLMRARNVLARAPTGEESRSEFQSPQQCHNSKDKFRENENEIYLCRRNGDEVSEGQLAKSRPLQPLNVDRMKKISRAQQLLQRRAHDEIEQRVSDSENIQPYADNQMPAREVENRADHRTPVMKRKKGFPLHAKLGTRSRESGALPFKRPRKICAASNGSGQVSPVPYAGRIGKISLGCCHGPLTNVQASQLIPTGKKLSLGDLQERFGRRGSYLSEKLARELRPVLGNPDGALQFRFDETRFGTDDLLSLLAQVFPASDDLILHFELDPGQNLGVEEFKKVVRLLFPTVRSTNHTSQVGGPEWATNVFDLAVWKLASIEAAFPMTRRLSFSNLMFVLANRIEREWNRAVAPPLLKIIRRDAMPGATCVCVVRQVLSANAITVSDGWYVVRAELDPALQSLLARNRIRTGDKLVFCGASVSRTGNSSGDEIDSSALQLHLNGTRKARWDARLGFRRRPITLQSLTGIAGGGIIGSCVVVIQRAYPLRFVETVDCNGEMGSKRIFRNEEAEERAHGRVMRKMEEDLFGLQQRSLEESLDVEVMDEIRESCTRTVSTLLEVQVSDSSGNCSGILTCWRPSEIQLSHLRREGSSLRLFNVQPGPNSEIDARGFRLSILASSPLVAIYSSDQTSFRPRRPLRIDALSSVTRGSDFDIPLMPVLVGSVQESARRHRFVYFCDSSVGRMLAVTFDDGEACGPPRLLEDFNKKRPHHDLPSLTYAMDLTFSHVDAQFDLVVAEATLRCRWLSEIEARSTTHGHHQECDQLRKNLNLDAFKHFVDKAEAIDRGEYHPSNTPWKPVP